MTNNVVTTLLLMPTSPERPASHRVVIARAPEVDFRQIRLGLHYKIVRDLEKTGRLTAIGEYVGIIVGECTLFDPVAIFQGLKRPFAGPGKDETVFVYVSNAQTSYAFSPGTKNTDLGPQRMAPPAELVFVTFVSLSPDVVDDVRQSLDPIDQAIDGAILYWEWTQASRSQVWFPRDHEKRYRRLVWASPLPQ